MSHKYGRGDTLEIRAGNRVLDGTRSIILDQVTYGGEPGYIVATSFGSNRFRALESELQPIPGTVAGARQAGYTGSLCPNPECGSDKVVRAGKCELCLACQTSIGGCS